jgi:hypothetical protein
MLETTQANIGFVWMEQKWTWISAVSLTKTAFVMVTPPVCLMNVVVQRKHSNVQTDQGA